MRHWLRGGQRCDWCQASFRSEADLAAYLDWCMHLRELRPTGSPMPEARVFCGDCAVGAIGELIDCVPYYPGRPVAESDPWTRAASLRAAGGGR